MSKAILSIIAIGVLLLLSGCTVPVHESLEAILSREIEVDVSGGDLLAHEETHGGFHGDGHTYAQFDYADDLFEKRILQSPHWQPLPMTDAAARLIDWNDEEHSTDSWLPYVQSGYYFVRDWQTEDGNAYDAAKISPFTNADRYSVNFTIAVYDSEARILYYARFDT